MEKNTDKNRVLFRTLESFPPRYITVPNVDDHDDGNETASCCTGDECSDLEDPHHGEITIEHHHLDSSHHHHSHHHHHDRNPKKKLMNVKSLLQNASKKIQPVLARMKQQSSSSSSSLSSPSFLSKSSPWMFYLFSFLLFVVLFVGLIAILVTLFILHRNLWTLTETAESYDPLDAWPSSSSLRTGRNVAVTVDLPIDNRPLYKILLIGDSLNNRPYKFWNLGGRLQQALPQYRLQIYNRARDSSKISEVANYIESDVKVNADMVFLFWDTDISNVVEDDFTSDQIIDIRRQYVKNITYVVDVTKASGVKYMAMAGPGLLGERDYPIFSEITLRTDFIGKNSMLDTYEALNRETAENLQVNYIDFRTAFIDALPSWWMLGRYYVTVDCEHPNLYGTEIMVKAYKKQIEDWLGVTAESDFPTVQ